MNKNNVWMYMLYVALVKNVSLDTFHTKRSFTKIWHFLKIHFLIFITIGQGGLTPSKCVKENIAERAAHIQTVMSWPESVTTPAKVSNTPGKVGSATKMMQQRLLEQAQHSKTDDIADRLRKDRMAELETLQKRYHNGILKDDRVPDTQVILILYINCPVSSFMGGTNLLII